MEHDEGGHGGDLLYDVGFVVDPVHVNDAFGLLLDSSVGGGVVGG